ncbi:putative Zinc finger protein [Quillaja saponaria]|uniref:Zinc finger protein n=1 Tax=Quillaja saponaria TaxID=32244 RepID=A0AAD7P5J2_QUISA|nr:putative Zinc finger protein [Quillaja saponaria]
MAAASSSTPAFGIREENQNQMIKQQHQSSATASSTAPGTVSQKKRRNQPGTTNPDAEVIALSPKTLMATNRFICEVCNKGFQREQNLQLHRRGHNLPWKLKQKSTKEPKRKVYLCPEPTCVHHDPSRALGDLTGIKKHYFRKHGEKKWKCEKCSKKYAVQSDWKAHSKTCGTREYRCDCGTLFSRRDSFITHRAFCDALAQETARHPTTTLNTMGSHLFGNNHINLGLSSQVGSQIPPFHQNQDHSSTSNNILRLGSNVAGATKFDHLISQLPSNIHSSSLGLQSTTQPMSMTPSAFFNMSEVNQGFQDQHQPQHHGSLFTSNKQLHGLMQFPDLQSNSAASSAGISVAHGNPFNLCFFPNTTANTASIIHDEQFNNGNGSNIQGTATLFSNHVNDRRQVGLSSHYTNSSVQDDHNAATSPHMSATALLQKAAQMGSTTTTTNDNSSSSTLLRGLGTKSDGQQLMSNTNNITLGSAEGIRSHMENDHHHHLHGLMNSLANGSNSLFGGAFNSMDGSKFHQNLGVSFGGSDKLTVDFLGVGGMVRNMRSSSGFSQRDQQYGLNMGSLDPDQLKSSQASQSQPFGRVNFE